MLLNGTQRQGGDTVDSRLCKRVEYDIEVGEGFVQDGKKKQQRDEPELKARPPSKKEKITALHGIAIWDLLSTSPKRD